MYCMFLNNLTGKAPMRSVYIVPLVASARVAKQSISWAAQALWAENIQSTSTWARITSACLLHVDAVLELWQRIRLLLVVVDLGRWEQINAGVRPGMVCNLVLLSRASSSVAASGEQRSWWTYWAYLVAEDVASTLAATAMADGLMVGVEVGLVDMSGVSGTIQSPTHWHLCLQTIVLLRYMIVHPIFIKVTVQPSLDIVTT